MALASECGAHLAPSALSLRSRKLAGKCEPLRMLALHRGDPSPHARAFSSERLFVRAEATALRSASSFRAAPGIFRFAIVRCFLEYRSPGVFPPCSLRCRVFVHQLSSDRSSDSFPYPNGYSGTENRSGRGSQIPHP